MSLEDLRAAKIVIATLGTAAKIPFEFDLSRDFFSVIAIDEAGQATEPEVVTVAAQLISTESGGLLVLAGDPHQLGPITHGESERRTGWLVGAGQVVLLELMLDMLEPVR